MKPHVCVDCKNMPITATFAPPGTKLRPKTPRPAPHGGPCSRRCTTHYRAWRKTQKDKRAESRVIKVYGLAEGEYDELYELQGGKCAICRRATGKTKRLAVDHDHDTGEVRGLLCSPCNKTVLSYGGDTLRSALAYLDNPPAAFLRAARLKESA